MPQREILPPNYPMAIAEINGIFYPVSVSCHEPEVVVLNNFPQYSWEVEDAWRIPPARGPRHRSGIVSFAKYASALNFCYGREEQFSLEIQWMEVAAGCEIYPERNAWYVDEIQKLTGMRPFISNVVANACASVLLRDEISCAVCGDTIDDVLVDLYEYLSVLTQEKERQSVTI